MKVQGYGATDGLIVTLQLLQAHEVDDLRLDEQMNQKRRDCKLTRWKAHEIVICLDCKLMELQPHRVAASRDQVY